MRKQMRSGEERGERGKSREKRKNGKKQTKIQKQTTEWNYNYDKWSNDNQISRVRGRMAMFFVSNDKQDASRDFHKPNWSAY